MPLFQLCAEGYLRPDAADPKTMRAIGSGLAMAGTRMTGAAASIGQLPAGRSDATSGALGP